MDRRLQPALLFLLLAALLPAQDSRRTDAAALLERIAETVGDSAVFGPAMLVEFVLRTDEPAYTLAARLWYDSLDEAPATKDAAGTLRAIRDNVELPGPKRNLAAQLRRALLARQGDVDALRTEIDEGRDGQIRSFMVIGPFGFYAESLAGCAFPPESGIDLAAEYPGYEDPVRWTPYLVSPAADSADPFEVLSPKSGATYALAQIHVVERRTVVVVVDSEWAAELFIDGQPALVLDRRREVVPDRRWVSVSFPEGWHHLLVKTTASGEGAFWVRLADPDGGPRAVPIESGRELHPVLAAAAGTGPGGAFVPMDVRDARWETVDRASALVAASMTASQGLAEAAFVAIEPLLKEDLSLGELWLARRIVDTTTHLPENDKMARLLDLAKRAVERKNQFAPAVVALAHNEAKNDRAEEGIGLAQKALDAHPKSVELWEAELEILASVGFDSDRERVLESALQACPGSQKLLDQRLAQLEAKHAVPAWIAVAKQELAANATLFELAQSLAGRLLAARQFDDLRRLLSVQRSLRPHDSLLGKLEAGLFHEEADLEGERGALEALAAAKPKDTGSLVMLAERAHSAGKAGEEYANLAVALGRNPDLHNVRRLLDEMRPPEHDYFKEFQVDTKAFLEKAPGPEAYPDSRIVLLLDQVVLWVHEDGTAEQEIHQLHRLQDPRGKDDLGTVRADGDVKIVQTILPDGSTLVPNPGGHGGYEMAGLAPGAIVERRFRRSRDRASGRPESFGGFFFQDTRLVQPFHYSRYVVIVPKKLGLVPVVERFTADFKKEERGDDLVYEFVLERVPRIQKEAMMPRAEDLAPHVEFRRPDKWNQINRRYLDVYEQTWRATPTIEEAAKTAVGGATDPLERARLLYGFVMDTVTSNEGTGSPTQTLLEKSGDRFPLYLALLKAAGVPHHLAMGRSQEKISPPINWQMVTDDLFDVPLARIEPPGADPVYVSTQLRYVPFGQIRFDLTDAPVFVTSAEGGRIDHVPPKPLADAKSAEMALELALDGAGVAQGTVRVTLHGWAGAYLKEQIERMEKKRLEQLATGFVLGPIGRLAPKPKGPVRFKNATSRTEPLVIEVDVEMKQLVRKTDGGGTLEVPFRPLSLAKGFVDRKERKLPFVFHQYLVEDSHATIDLDPAWKVGDLPKDFNLAGPLGSFTLRRTLDGTKLILRREVALTPADIPASGFPDVASFAKDVDQAEAQKITLRREPQ